MYFQKSHVIITKHDSVTIEANMTPLKQGQTKPHPFPLINL